MFNNVPILKLNSRQFYIVTWWKYCFNGIKTLHIINQNTIEKQNILLSGR